MSNISKAFLLKKYRARNHYLELVNYVALIILLLVSVAGISLLGQLKAFAEEVPTEQSIRQALSYKGENSRIYDRNGVLLYTFKDPERDREYAEFDEIPPVVVVAALAAEDKDFFIHEGIDYLGATKGLATTFATGGDIKVGGSTITQQLTKQTLLTTDQTFERKIKEAIITLQVERDYEKEDILEYYLNVSPYGGRIQGVKTAAKTYFDKEIENLTLNESIFLMSLVQSPGDYSPLFANDVEEAHRLSDERRQQILSQVIANPRLVAYLNSEDLDILSEKDQGSIDITAGMDSPVYSLDSIEALKDDSFTFTLPIDQLKAPHWVFYIRGILQNEPYGLSIEDLYSGGYEIHTSLDLRVQDLADQKLKEGVDKYGPRYNFENGALVTIDARNGEIIAMAGSKGYNLPNDPNNKRFDPEVNVTVSRQQLGSTLKPWVAYMAFDSGRYGKYSRVLDKPKTFYGFYKPKNSDGRFYGEITMHKALLDSRNLPFLRISYELGDWRLPELMKETGYRQDTTYGLAATIGGVDESLLDNTAAYTGFANGGSVMKMKPVLRIINSDGTTGFEAQTEVRKELNRGAIGTVNSILGDKRYTPHNYPFKFYGRQQLAGKTGTGEANKDTYYMGYGPKFVTGVWCGNNDNSRMYGSAYGSRTALPIWSGYTRAMLDQFPEYGESGTY